VVRVGDGAHPVRVTDQHQILHVLGPRLLEYGQPSRRISRAGTPPRQHFENDALAAGNITILQARRGGLDEQPPVCCQRGIPLRGGDLRLVSGRRESRGKREKDDTCYADRNSVAPCEFARTIDEAVAARDDRLAPQEALDVLRERIHRCIASCRALAQRLEYDGVEVPRQQAGQFSRRDASRVRCRIAQLETTRRDSVLFEDRLLERSTGIAFGPIWPLACQQLVEHYTEGVDIRRRGNRTAGDLLRR